MELNTGQAVTISFSAINDVYITLLMQFTYTAERMAFYERFYAMKSQYYHWYAAKFHFFSR